MNATNPPGTANSPDNRPHYPNGFRARRGLNWGIIGLMYASFYMCRYNFPLANPLMSKEFGFTNEQVGWIISINMIAYGCGQLINGFLADKLGGKRTMLIGAAGTIILNIMFGIASFWGLLGLFMMLRGIDGYMQAFGSPGFMKINVRWFHKSERGVFAGIFGFMINLGRLSIGSLGPSLLAGFLLLGLWQIPALHWRWLFWVPAGIATIVAIALAIFVKNSPEEAGYHIDHLKEPEPLRPDGKEIGMRDVLVKIASNPVVWMVALAYACTGVVRQSVDQWFPRYMLTVFDADMKGAHFQWLVFMIPFVASFGSLTSGLISDKIFKGSRAPVAAGIYFVETLVILTAAQMTSINAVVVFFILISFTANSTHSLLGVAAAMDIGGHRMTGFAAGVIDSFQYFGGALAGVVLGILLDSKIPAWIDYLGTNLAGLDLKTSLAGLMGWDGYFYFMAPFGMLGCILIIIAHKISKRRGVVL